MAPATPPTDFYTRRAARLQRDLARQAPIFRAGLAEHLPPDLVDSIWAAAQAEFARLIPRLPYVGGRGNPFTSNIVQSAWFLGLYRALQAAGHGGAAELTAISDAVAAHLIAGRSRLVTRLQGRLAGTRLHRALFRRLSATSAQRRYPADFVIELVEPDPAGRFDFGYNFHECGICKLFAAEGAAHLTPNLCRIDFQASARVGLTLTRTGTLALGADHCDFRFKKLAA